MTCQHQQKPASHCLRVPNTLGIKSADNGTFEIVTKPIAIETAFDAGDLGQEPEIACDRASPHLCSRF